MKDVQGRRPSARIVIVNWRQSDLTIQAARSLQSQLSEGDRLVVVDNGSGDGSAPRIRKAGFEVVEAATNGGFAAGVNLGAQDLTEDALVLLNNDAVARPGFLSALLGGLGGSVGATTALLLLTGRGRLALPGEEGERALDGRLWTRVDEGTRTTVGEQGEGVELVNSTGNVVDRHGNGYDRDWLTPVSQLDAPAEVFGICGGACAIAAQPWKELGGLREDLFMYYEDSDFSYRLRQAGYEVRFVEEAVAQHEHSASSGTNSEMFIRVNTRNRLLVAADHASRVVFLDALVRTIVRALRTGLRGPVAQGLREALRRLTDKSLKPPH